jgi:hypothetical protein
MKKHGHKGHGHKGGAALAKMMKINDSPPPSAEDAMPPMDNAPSAPAPTGLGAGPALGGDNTNFGGM